MRAIGKILGARVASEILVGSVVQSACYVGAIAVLILGLRRLPSVAHTERDVLFGVLLVVAVSLLMVTLGTVTHVVILLERGATRERP